VKNQRAFSLVGWLIVVVLAAGVLARGISEARALTKAREVIDDSRHTDESSETLRQISSSLARAREAHKQVILQFGSHGCTWCRLLEKAFESDQRIAQVLERNFIIVKVDVSGENNRRVNVQYGNPIGNGLPVCVFLDSNGKQLLTRNIAFADDEMFGGYGVASVDPDKILAFLKQQAERTPL
jgi:thioredoxin-related protein